MVKTHKHCRPCPKGLEIDLINKYYDLARLGDELAYAKYIMLEKKASDCIGCKKCEERCTFAVKQSEKMKIIAEFFG